MRPGPSSSPALCVMTKDGIDLAGGGLLEQRRKMAVRVCLPGLEGEALIHERARQDLVQIAEIHAGATTMVPPLGDST